MIKVAGFQKNSFIDYPGKICAMVFLGGCNMRCYFCHNFDILSSKSNIQDFSEVLEEIKEQIGFIDAVGISGGEPTLHPQLRDIIEAIRALRGSKGDRLLIKLDTNGSNPQMLRDLVEGGLLDYVAIDVKCAFDRSDVVKGIDTLASRILESIDYLKNQTKIDYMFRTTLAPALDIDDIRAIAEMVKGAKTHQLQQFIPNENSESSCFAGLRPFTPEQVQEFAKEFEGKVGRVLIRGF